jgi:hypothetical protein
MRCCAGLPTFADCTVTSALFHCLFILYYATHIFFIPNPYLHPLLSVHALHPLVDICVAWAAFLLQLLVLCCFDCRTQHEDKSEYQEQGVPLMP